jgi:hypothetical protein
MNTTDKQKQVILKMFKQPIEDVEEAVEAYIDVIDDNCGLMDFGDASEIDSIRNELRDKISNLKATLPTLQDSD